MTTAPNRLRLRPNTPDASVTPLELFFDLVFVFALTRVTAYMADHLTWHGFVQGLLIIGLLWWSWVCYAWLGNLVTADEGVCRLGLFAGMGAMLVLALTIPEAYEDLPGGLYGPAVIAVCYFAFRAVHLVLFWFAVREDPEVRAQTLRFIPSMVVATVLLLVAAQLDGVPQTLLWAAALLADYGGTLLSGSSWRLRSVSHFTERHGLILIVALGESIVAIGVGIAALPISVPVVAAALLGLTLSAGLWWAYFDVTARAAEQALASVPAERRAKVARDAYTYLHLPMVTGIVLTALGLKKTLEYVGDTEHHHLSDALHGIGLYALYGGVALYVLGHVLFKMDVMREVNRIRVVTVVVTVVLVPLAEHVPALMALAFITLLVAAMLVAETWTHRDRREAIRHG
jgi:low temperature requirement protein LtrA